MDKRKNLDEKFRRRYPDLSPEEPSPEIQPDRMEDYARHPASEGRYLTVDAIAQACGEEEKKTNKFGAVFFSIVLIIELITLCGLEPMEMLEQILDFWILYIPVTAFCVAALKIMLWDPDPVDKAIREGRFHLICTPVNDMVEYSDADDYKTYTLYFNYHEKRGRSSLQVTKEEYRSAYIGRLYYLVLQQHKSGTVSALRIYPVESNRLDEQLTRKLQEDMHLTGEFLPKGKLRERLNRPEEQFTPAQEEARKPELQALERKAWIRLLTGVAATVLLLIPGSNLIRGAEWYWKLLYTVVWLYAGIWQLLKYYGAEYKIMALRRRMTSYRGKAKLRVVVWMVAVLLNVFVLVCVLAL